VGEVVPVRSRVNVVAQAPLPKPIRTPWNEEEEVMAELCELVAGTAPFDLADSDEYIEGAVASLDRRLLRRLRRGEYAIQGHLDLHGFGRREAKRALLLFLEESRRLGKRCVLVIHGKGLHSKDQIPVLKEGMQVWLTKGRLGGQVLAFTTAQPHDGGAGAIYVLLRR
jgi:DNA-nicking Smr family endonuclease